MKLSHLPHMLDIVALPHEKVTMGEREHCLTFKSEQITPLLREELTLILFRTSKYCLGDTL